MRQAAALAYSCLMLTLEAQFPQDACFNIFGLGLGDHDLEWFDGLSLFSISASLALFRSYAVAAFPRLITTNGLQWIGKVMLDEGWQTITNQRHDIILAHQFDGHSQDLLHVQVDHFASRDRDAVLSKQGGISAQLKDVRVVSLGWTYFLNLLGLVLLATLAIENGAISRTPLTLAQHCTCLWTGVGLPGLGNPLGGLVIDKQPPIQVDLIRLTRDLHRAIARWNQVVPVCRQVGDINKHGETPLHDDLWITLGSCCNHLRGPADHGTPTIDWKAFPHNHIRF